MSFLTELDTHLEALKTKVTKSRIQAVTTLCVENVKVMRINYMPHITSYLD